VPRLLFAAPLVVRRRYLIVVPRPMPAAPCIYLIVVYRPLLAAPLVVRCIYKVAVQIPMPAAVASRCCRRRFQQLAYVCGTKSRRGAQAGARGAMQVLDRDVQAVARGAARCALHVLGRAVVPRTIHGAVASRYCRRRFSTARLRPRHNMLTCKIMLKASRDAAAAEEDQLTRCAAERSK
jgi:hypothetical protein